MKKNLKRKIIFISFTAVMSALYVVLSLLFTIPIGTSMKISLTGLPVLISSFLLGPLCGGITGGIGEFFAQFLRYGLEATTVLWVIPHILRGVTAGLIFKAFSKKPNVLPIAVSTFVSAVVLTVLNTVSMYLSFKFFGNPSGYMLDAIIGVTFFMRLLTQTVTAAVYTVILIPLIKIGKREF